MLEEKLIYTVAGSHTLSNHAQRMELLAYSAFNYFFIHCIYI